MNRRDFLKGLAAAGVISPVAAQRLLAEPEPIEPAFRRDKQVELDVTYGADVTTLALSDGRVERRYPIVELSVTSELLDVSTMDDDFPQFVATPELTALEITVDGTVDLEIGETYGLAVRASDLHARCDRAILTGVDTEFPANANVQTHLTLRLLGAFTIEE